MSKPPSFDWDGSSRRRRRSRRKRRSHDARGDRADEFADLDESLLTPEERAYREVRERAEERADAFLAAGKAGIVVFLLLLFPVLFPFGVVGLIWWGIVHGRKLFRLMVEPGLKEKLVEEEISRHVESKVGNERVDLADDHARKLEVLAASIAHEIRNPVTAAKSLLQQMGEQPDALENPEYAQIALAELERVERSVSHLLRFSREEDLRMGEVKMADVLDSALETFRERADRNGVAIEREFDCEGVLFGDSEKLRRVVINLVGNAMDSLVDAGVESPRIEVSMGENLASTEVWVRISDNGLGLDEETRAKIFSPMFTTKKSGTGLGLAITKKLVDAHQGTIEVGRDAGHGAEFVLRLPKRVELGGNGGSRGGKRS